MQPSEQYTYRVSWSAEDGEYVATCAELTGLSWLAKTPEAALRGVRRVAQEAVQILEQDGDPVPEPLATRAYSGVFKVRIPPEVHRGLVQEATEQGVSLNRLVTVKLAGRTSLGQLRSKRSKRQPNRPRATRSPGSESGANRAHHARPPLHG